MESKLFSLSTKYLEQFCQSCLCKLKFERKFTCFHCKKLNYCSESCKQKDDLHFGLECDFVQRCTPNVPINLQRLFFRFIKFYKINIAEFKVKFKPFLKEKEDEQILILAKLIKHHCQDEVFLNIKSCNENDLKDILIYLKLNIFNIKQEEAEEFEEEDLGISFLDKISIFNHSCQPNSECIQVNSSNGLKIKVVAIKDISKNEEVNNRYEL